MNLLFFIILGTILLEFVVDLVVSRLNLGSMKDKVPAEFEGVYDEASYAKSQEYTRVNTRFGWVQSVFSVSVLTGFWFAGGFQMVDQWVRSFGFGEVGTGLLFFGVLAGGRMVLSLPFSLYGTFVIEERFGFNKTTPGVFVSDLLKGLVLSAVLGAPVLAAVILFFEEGGEWAWLYAWVGLSLFSYVMMILSPSLIMPLFNKFEPLGEGELREAIEAYAAKVAFPLEGIFVMDGSKRSSKANAFFTGFGKRKRIALFDTLIENHTTEELVAVLAHEIGHYKRKHVGKNVVLSGLQSGVMLFLLSLFLKVPALYEAFFMEEMSVYAGLLFFGLLYSPVSLVTGVLMQMLSRKYEFEADRYAVETTGQPEWMVRALKRLSKDHLSHLTPHPLYVFLNYSHPPVLKRIEAIRAVGAGLGGGDGLREGLGMDKGAGLGLAKEGGVVEGEGS